jgi:hypothetical protein
MGFELRVRGVGGTWPPHVVAPETLIARLPHDVSFADRGLSWTRTAPGAIEARERRVDAQAMPDVSVTVEDGGFYLLDNNHALASLVLGVLVRYLLGSFESVSIAEA